MVDPAGVGAFVAAVDHAAGAEREEEGVEGIVGVGRVAAVGFLGADARAAVFDDARARGDFAGGEDAVAVQLGAADDMPGLDRGVFGGHGGLVKAVRRNRIISTRL
ncbi:hypothetical protein G6F40_015637 [Rhizopus arrhizus]|nr:hypothetical protein G6F40_015637 [Rhizopus arrhizus]